MVFFVVLVVILGFFSVNNNLKKQQAFLPDFLFSISEKAKGISKEQNNLFNSWDDKEL